LTLFDVDAARAASLAAELQHRFAHAKVASGGSLPDAMREATGLIHATPTGMAKLPGLPLPAELLHRELWVADVVYFPIRTALIEAAERAGCHTLSGGGMAVYQAVDAFRLFTGVEPDADRMVAHLQSLLAQ
jgi:shikimate dehydrogenase